MLFLASLLLYLREGELKFGRLKSFSCLCVSFFCILSSLEVSIPELRSKGDIISAKFGVSSSILSQILLVGLGPISRRPTDRRVLLFGGGDVFSGDARLCVTLLCKYSVGAISSFASVIDVYAIIVPSSAIFPEDSGASRVF